MANEKQMSQSPLVKKEAAQGIDAVNGIASGKKGIRYIFEILSKYKVPQISV